MCGKVEIRMTTKLSTGVKYASIKDLVAWIKSLEPDADKLESPLEAIQYIKEGLYEISL